MGADLLITHIWTTHPEGIDFDAARALIRDEITDEAEGNDAFWTRWDPNEDFWPNEWDDEGKPDMAALRDKLLADTDEIADLWSGENEYRDAYVLTMGPLTVLISGGMSYGDSPTESFDLINRWANTPAAKAAGFYDGT